VRVRFAAAAAEAVAVEDIEGWEVSFDAAYGACTAAYSHQAASDTAADTGFAGLRTSAADTGLDTAGRSAAAGSVEPAC